MMPAGTIALPRGNWRDILDGLDLYWDDDVWAYPARALIRDVSAVIARTPPNDPADPLIPVSADADAAELVRYAGGLPMGRVQRVPLHSGATIWVVLLRTWEEEEFVAGVFANADAAAKLAGTTSRGVAL